MLKLQAMIARSRRLLGEDAEKEASCVAVKNQIAKFDPSVCDVSYGTFLSVTSLSSPSKTQPFLETSQPCSSPPVSQLCTSRMFRRVSGFAHGKACVCSSCWRFVFRALFVLLLRTHRAPLRIVRNKTQNSSPTYCISIHRVEYSTVFLWFQLQVLWFLAEDKTKVSGFSLKVQGTYTKNFWLSDLLTPFRSASGGYGS